MYGQILFTIVSIIQLEQASSYNVSMKKALAAIVIVISLVWLYSYKLLDIPTGLTVDEASFGYNAVLISQTGRDQNDRFLPLFVLTSDGKDWRQPVTQYYFALLFKIFGPSIWLLRFGSVIIAIVSVFGVYYLARPHLSQSASLIAALVMATSPLLFIQSHLGLDNIMPIPFVIIWLVGLRQYLKSKSRRWLIGSALALGISFYSYKGMRPIVPVWGVLSLIWLYLTSGKKRLINPAIFSAVLFPFFAIVPLVERLYAGAILGGATPSYNNPYDFFRPFLSSFDPSYLFVVGDIVANHSTGRHGVLLLSSLPLFIIGACALLKEKNPFPKFILAALVAAPLLFGLVGSVHRFSRLMSLLPLFAISAGFGWQYLVSQKSALLRALAVILLVLFTANFLDFVRFYWKNYEGISFTLVGEMDYYKDLDRMAKEAKERGLTPVIHKQVRDEGGESIKFFQTIYFGKLLPVVENDLASENGTILLTTREEIKGMRPVGERTHYYVQVRD